jgi:hypothetical protein
VPDWLNTGGLVPPVPPVFVTTFVGSYLYAGGSKYFEAP